MGDANFLQGLHCVALFDGLLMIISRCHAVFGWEFDVLSWVDKNVEFIEDI